tara:strand:+ start:92 stop:523 length:432 start_codon:yes stop_codon:yes gene_type:complete
MRKKDWSKEELTIAYYIAKWDLSGIDSTMEELALVVIGNTTVKSLDMQVMHFRRLLNLEENTLFANSKRMEELRKDYKDLTMTQVRKLVVSKIQSCSSDIISYNKNKAVLESSKRVEKLNAASELLFQNKIKELKKHRNLRKK